MTTISKPTLPVKTTEAPDARSPALDTSWPAQESAAVGDNAGDANLPNPSTERREPGHIDSALESLGEAISEPVRDAAEEMSNDTTERPSSAATPRPTEPVRRS